jgi:hypothetical protein
MRRLLIPALCSAALAFNAGAALAASPSLAGNWTTTIGGHPIKLQLKGSGADYTGTYASNSATVVKGKVKNTAVIVPVKAVMSTKKNVVHVVLTFTKTKNTSQCVLAKEVLTCQAAFGGLPIVFKHTT